METAGRFGDRLMKNYCDFNGMLKDKNRWIEEFRMLEEPRDHPNFEAMTDKLGVLMTLPKDIIKKCPRLKDYLTELVKYNANNEKIKKEISRAIEFISEKLSDDLVEYKEEL